LNEIKPGIFGAQKFDANAEDFKPMANWSIIYLMPSVVNVKCQLIHQLPDAIKSQCQLIHWLHSAIGSQCQLVHWLPDAIGSQCQLVHCFSYAKLICNLG
jgi:hypothetical protein